MRSQRAKGGLDDVTSSSQTLSQARALCDLQALRRQWLQHPTSCRSSRSGSLSSSGARSRDASACAHGCPKLVHTELKERLSA